MAKTPAKTPIIAITRVLSNLGLKPGTDFTVSGHYVRLGRTLDGVRELTGAYVVLLSRLAHETVAKHADAIEDAAKTDDGWSFSVSIRYGKRTGDVYCYIDDRSPRTRETAPVTEAAPVAEAEDRATPIGAVSDDVTVTRRFNVTGIPSVPVRYTSNHMVPTQVTVTYRYNPQTEASGWVHHHWTCVDIGVVGNRVLKPGSDGEQRIGLVKHKREWHSYHGRELVTDDPVRADLPVQLLKLIEDMRPSGEVDLPKT